MRSYVTNVRPLRGYIVTPPSGITLVKIIIQHSSKPRSGARKLWFLSPLRGFRSFVRSYVTNVRPLRGYIVTPHSGITLVKFTIQSSSKPRSGARKLFHDPELYLSWFLSPLRGFESFVRSYVTDPRPLRGYIATRLEKFCTIISYRDHHLMGTCRCMKDL